MGCNSNDLWVGSIYFRPGDPVANGVVTCVEWPHGQEGISPQSFSDGLSMDLALISRDLSNRVTEGSPRILVVKGINVTSAHVDCL